MDLIKTAKENGVIVAAFHQSLYAPSFKGVKDFIKSGILGDVFQISLKYSGFARRWDWQTVQRCCAGSVFNSGPHPIGQALDMLGWDKNFRVEYSDLKTVLTSGDAEDYGKIILKAPNKPTIDIEICSVDAYSDFVFKVYGSKGTLKATNESYELKRIEPEKLDPKPVTLKPLMDEEFRPLYCSEKLPIIEEKGKFSGSSFDSAVKEYYEMLYATIMEGKPLEISPEMASEVIRVIEICHAQNPLPVKF
jgi:predicted dehydrogenase